MDLGQGCKAGGTSVHVRIRREFLLRVAGRIPGLPEKLAVNVERAWKHWDAATCRRLGAAWGQPLATARVGGGGAGLGAESVGACSSGHIIKAHIILTSARRQRAIHDDGVTRQQYHDVSEDNHIAASCCTGLVAYPC